MNVDAPPPNLKRQFAKLCAQGAAEVADNRRSLADVTDALQQWAERQKLVHEISQDAVQAIMTEAFRDRAP